MIIFLQKCEVVDLQICMLLLVACVLYVCKLQAFFATKESSCVMMVWIPHYKKSFFFKMFNLTQIPTLTKGDIHFE